LYLFNLGGREIFKAAGGFVIKEVLEGWSGRELA
jgi:hypothetical protein